MEFKEMFEPIINFIKGLQKKEKENSKDEAKKRLQLVLMQDRASVSPDFFEMMKKEIIEVIKKYIEIDEDALEVQLTRGFEGGLEGPALYANIPIKNIKPVAKKVETKNEDEEIEVGDKKEENKEIENQETENNKENDEVSTKDVDNGEIEKEVLEDNVENAEKELNGEEVEDTKQNSKENTDVELKENVAPKKSTTRSSKTKTQTKKATATAKK